MMIRKSPRVLFAWLAIACLGGAMVAQAEEPPAPPGCHWQPIPKVKVYLPVPDGWTFRTIGEGEDASYEVLPAGPAFKATPEARFKLSVSRKKPEEAVALARGFVQSISSGSSESAPIEEHTVSVMRTFATVARYAPGIAGVPSQYIAVSADANSSTGAVYTIRFAIPESEWQSVWAQGVLLFSWMRLDDEF
jgi:hypothetical protein